MKKEELPEGYYANENEDGKIVVGHVYLEDGAYRATEEVLTKTDFDKLTVRRLENKFSGDPDTSESEVAEEQE